MRMSDSKEVAKVEKAGEVAVYTDDFGGYTGFENFTGDSIKIPYLKLLQGMSQEITAGIGTVGNFFVTSFDKELGKSVRLIVLGIKEGRVTEYTPQPEGKFVASHLGLPHDALQRQNPFGYVMPNGNQLKTADYYYCIDADRPDDGIMVFTLGQTFLKYSRDWKTRMRMLKTPSGQSVPMMGVIWRVSVTMDQKDGKSWPSIGTSNTKRANVVVDDFVTRDHELYPYVLVGLETFKSLADKETIIVQGAHVTADTEEGDW